VIISHGVLVTVAGVLVLLPIISAFNGLVALRNRVRNAWSDIEVQLERRHDLIPSLVEAVRGYMADERETLETVTNARARAIASLDNVAARASAENTLTGAVGKVFAVAERYPRLRAVESVQLLQEQLISTESRIAFARQFYNDCVMEYNTAQMTFPRNIVAGALGFSRAMMFAANEPSPRNPAVKL
jgi:LemA protein